MNFAPMICETTGVYILRKDGRTVRKSPISLARDALSHNASTLDGSRL